MVLGARGYLSVGKMAIAEPGFVVCDEKVGSLVRTTYKQEMVEAHPLYREHINMSKFIKQLCSR
tara:strand:- start:30 stop:221 length:192 start_codon:yes stop_codon:yes gene_type:complete